MEEKERKMRKMMMREKNEEKEEAKKPVVVMTARCKGRLHASGVQFHSDTFWGNSRGLGERGKGLDLKGEHAAQEPVRESEENTKLRQHSSS